MKPEGVRLPPPVDQGWQPIETAPKTSRHILVWTPGNRCCSLVVWCDTVVTAGRWEHAFSGHDSLMDEPTHWMPLPLPPGEAQSVDAASAAVGTSEPCELSEGEASALVRGLEDIRAGRVSGFESHSPAVALPDGLRQLARKWRSEGFDASQYANELEALLRGVLPPQDQK